MNVLITGGTGFVGSALTYALQQLSDIKTIYIATRDELKVAKQFEGLSKVRAIQWMDNNYKLPHETIAKIDVLINLMGENIASGRWTQKTKEIIYNSRVKSTLSLAGQFQHVNNDLKLHINSSAIGIYPINTGRHIIESEEVFDYGFLSHVCIDWESAAAEIPCQRKLILRTGVVLGENGGAIKKLRYPFLCGVGGILGDGHQYMSWIHRDDLITIIISAINDNSYEGIVNATSPFPITNYEFTKCLGKVVSRPTIFSVPVFVLKSLLGEMSSILLDDQHITSKNLKEIDHSFKFPKIETALRDIFK